ncbi:methylmalonyl-CoA mutase subunit beta [Sutcliffiella horikoshii]|uniref:methylmalonyl-CoA mutase family protein n=1 Tax=Sutcliffiella horikoshii TaxID=79883 RepID=UPI00203EDD13|nr:methylmalonyl-CoA mutase family protein [Sutcliffiella horikoshii]MCM3617602.1 methylmalonyl-CoA mutase subunit beta [Sutcliffiella horikoshii]
MSRLKEMKNNSFPKVAMEEWVEQAEKALKGKPISKLNTVTYEGITRKPVYTKNDINDHSFKQLIDKSDWTVSQQLYPSTSFEELNAQLKQELRSGLQSIHFATYPSTEPNALVIKEQKDIKTIFSEISLNNIPLQIHAGSSATTFINALIDSGMETNNLQGIIGADPVGELAATGTLNKPLKQYYDEMKSNIEWKENNAPYLKTVWIQSNPYHNGGANAVQELAAAMATAVEYLQELMNRGMSIDAASQEIAFTFPVGSDFFMELSKLRAARVLWANIVEAFGGDDQAQKMTVHATTSMFTKSNLDPYVNMLRTTSEAFSAAIGGADSINVDSYQQGGDVFSRRIARNTHYILKEESFLDKVVDPAAGSYYVENLTNQLEDEAWNLFQKLEKLGGIVEALRRNFLQDCIAEVKGKRLKDVQNRKKVLVGTNMYANLQQKLKQQISSKPIEENELATVKVQAIQPLRLSVAFESLRYQAKLYQEKEGTPPKVTLLNLGSLATHKPRTDFSSGFFQVGGLLPVVSPSFEDANEIVEWSSAHNITGYVCICGSDDTYEELLNAAVMTINSPNRKILVAGLPDATRQKEMQEIGVSDFIHMRSNCYEQLVKIHQEMGLTDNEA